MKEPLTCRALSPANPAMLRPFGAMWKVKSWRGNCTSQLNKTGIAAFCDGDCADARHEGGPDAREYSVIRSCERQRAIAAEAQGGLHI
jgi:hypothetical protein